MNIQNTISAKYKLPPTIVVLKDSLTGKMDEELSLPSAIVQDDVDGNVRLFVMLVAPSAKILSHGEYASESAIDAYTFTEKGMWYIRYYAVDSSGNVTIKDIPVTIS